MRKIAALIALAFAILLLASACGGGPADPTAREITDEELTLMILPQSELGPQYADFELDEDSGFQSNEDEIEEDFDPEDAEEDIKRFSRVNGYEESYFMPDALFEEAVSEKRGAFGISTGVSLYEDADGASGNLKDGVEDAKREVGTTNEDVTLEEAKEFDPDGIGDESAGLFLTLKVSGGQELTFYGTSVGFTRGRLLGSVYIARLDDEDVREEAAALARKLDERILAALRGEVKATPTAIAATPTATPTVAPATGKIAFLSDRDGNSEIYVMNADGSAQTNLTNNPADDVYPAWSPDGSRIAFASDRDGNFEVYVMNADSSGQTRLTDNAEGNDYPDWSPDGSRIAFASGRDGNGEIYVMNADGTGQTRLTNHTANDRLPVWSPDGKRIAFQSNRLGDDCCDFDKIYVMNADGTGLTNLTNVDECCVAWSPDGKRIAFSSNRDLNYEVYVMNADGTGQTNLTNNPGVILSNPVGDYGPAWSPDGSRIAFESCRDGNCDIYVMNADGSDQTPLTDNPALDSEPAWSPAANGEALALLPLMVLQLEDLPSGFKVYDSGLDTLEERADDADDAGQFQRRLESWGFILGHYKFYAADTPSEFPEIYVEIWLLKDVPAAEEAFIDGGLYLELAGVVTPVEDFPVFGDESEAYRFVGPYPALSGEEIQAEGHMVIIRSGPFLAVLQTAFPPGQTTDDAAIDLATKLEARMAEGME